MPLFLGVTGAQFLDFMVTNYKTIGNISEFRNPKILCDKRVDDPPDPGVVFFNQAQIFEEISDQYSQAGEGYYFFRDVDKFRKFCVLSTIVNGEKEVRINFFEKGQFPFF